MVIGPLDVLSADIRDMPGASPLLDSLSVRRPNHISSSMNDCATPDTSGARLLAAATKVNELLMRSSRE